MEESAAKSFSFLLPWSVVVLAANLLACSQARINERVTAQAASATFPQLFQATCDGTGGCKQDCLNGSTSCQCAAGSASQWFTTNTGASPSITISAAPANQNYCQTVSTQNTCQFNLGQGGVTQITFDFAVTTGCSIGGTGTEWLAFWMYNNPWNGRSEVDFVESRFGPGTGLNTNFDANGNQVVIFPDPPPPAWSGSINATFSGTGNAVSVSVHSSQNSTGTTILNSSTGYFFVMDTAGGSQYSSCTITVSNLAVQGSVPSTLNGAPNCAGLPVVTNN